MKEFLVWSKVHFVISERINALQSADPTKENITRADELIKIREEIAKKLGQHLKVA